MDLHIPSSFILGASASAEQTEGWKGKKAGQDSYMDAWFKNEPSVWNGDIGPDIATNFMESYEVDISLMKEFGIDAYRTSINWARFFTDYEHCVVDEEYAKHISDMIDAQIDAGVEPMLCLHHFELPWQLWEEQGGWGSRHVVDLFVSYARIAFDRYGDRVKTWFTFNEPIQPPLGALLEGDVWPYERDTAKYLLWNYHKALATALTVRLYKSGNYGGRIGCILNIGKPCPRSQSPRDVEAARLYDLFFNRLYLDPLILGEYSQEILDIAAENGISLVLSSDDLAVIKKNTIDLLGVNLYFPPRIKAPQFAHHPEESFNPSWLYEMYDLPGCKMNESRGWEIYPKTMYDTAMYLKERYNNIPWIVTENGMGVQGEERYLDANGMVVDDYRIEFVASHLRELLHAVEDGANCEGYMLWSFTDCISPRNNFRNRYGYIRIDVENDLARVPKKSAYWHKELSKTRLLSCGE